MDFFGILYDMKNGKKVPYSKTYFDTLFAAKLAQLEIKTLTGTLPLTFRTSENALRSWTIYGNNYKHKYSTSGTLPLTFTTQTAGNADGWSITGNDNVGKNFLALTTETMTIHGVEYVVNASDGTAIATRIASSSNTGNYVIRLSFASDTQLILSGCPTGGGTTSYNVYAWDYTTASRCKQWDGTTPSDTDYGSGNVQVLFPANHNTAVICRIQNAYDAQNVVFKPMLRLPNTSATFEAYQVGVGERTKNLVDLSNITDSTSNGVTFTVDSANGIITANRTATGTANSTKTFNMTLPAGTYVFSCGENSQRDITYDCYLRANNATIARDNPDDPPGSEFTLTTETTFTFYIRIQQSYNAQNLVFRPMIRPADTSTGFIPFGYEVPLTVNNTTQDIYIGSTPLTAGQSISKTSTGVDIAAIVGSNTITTELYNKPEMAITGVDYVGVGEPINDSWQIPLAVTCDRNLFNIYGNMAYSGGVHLINYNVETSSVTGEMSADSYYILGIANAIVKGDETFVISFDKSTAGTAELRMTKGTGSSAEIIETFDISEIKSYRIVFECEESFGNVYPRLVATEAATNTFEHIMIKKASDKGGFVPYGAKYEYNVPINAPLTEGQSVTDTVTISTFEGENVLDTTLTNKPQMTITYKGG